MRRLRVRQCFGQYSENLPQFKSKLEKISQLCIWLPLRTFWVLENNLLKAKENLNLSHNQSQSSTSNIQEKHNREAPRHKRQRCIKCHRHACFPYFCAGSLAGGCLCSAHLKLKFPSVSTKNHILCFLN